MVPFTYRSFVWVNSRVVSAERKNKFKAENKRREKKQKRWAEFFLPVIYPIIVYFIQNRFRFRRDTTWAMWWGGSFVSGKMTVAAQPTCGAFLGSLQCLKRDRGFWRRFSYWIEFSWSRKGGHIWEEIIRRVRPHDKDGISIRQSIGKD